MMTYDQDVLVDPLACKSGYRLRSKRAVRRIIKPARSSPSKQNQGKKTSAASKTQAMSMSKALSVVSTNISAVVQVKPAIYKPANTRVTRKHVVDAGLEFMRRPNSVEVIVATNVHNADIMDFASRCLKEAPELNGYRFKLTVDHGALKIISMSSGAAHGHGLMAIAFAVNSWIESNGIDGLLAITGDTIQKFGGGVKELAPDVVIHPVELAPNEPPNLDDTSNPRVVIEFEVSAYLPT